MKNEMFYCILRDQHNKEYEVRGAVSDDTAFFSSVFEANKRGNMLQANVVLASHYKSIDELKSEGDPGGYTYKEGLFEKYDVRLH